VIIDLQVTCKRFSGNRRADDKGKITVDDEKRRILSTGDEKQRIVFFRLRDVKNWAIQNTRRNVLFHTKAPVYQDEQEGSNLNRRGGMRRRLQRDRTRDEACNHWTVYNLFATSKSK
jgi:hypothetical protein